MGRGETNVGPGVVAPLPWVGILVRSRPCIQTSPTTKPHETVIHEVAIEEVYVNDNSDDLYSHELDMDITFGCLEGRSKSVVVGGCLGT